jgi:hypothetical protein
MDTIGILTKERYKNQLRNNLMGTVNNSGIGATAGLEQSITTLTTILAGVVEKKFYELNGHKLSDFVKINVGAGAYATQLLQYAVNYIGNDGEQGLINPSADGINKDMNVSIQVGALNLKNNFWRAVYSITNELAQMGRINDATFSIVEEKEKARKKTWDLMLQKTFFNGLSDGSQQGILTQSDVTVNQTIYSNALSAMSDSEFTTFIAQLAPAYQDNADYTMNFNRMILPAKEYFALTTPFGQYGLNRLQVLEDAMKRVNGEDFRILPVAYANNAITSNAPTVDGTNPVIVLYNDDADNLEAYLPVPYTPMPLFPQGSLDLVSQAHGQFIPPYLKRTNSMLYLAGQTALS